ncbi:uncharacterized protein LOC131169349 [Hevea brasiliensis]|uniref:uncharacterized protein LOC131169349 n=1 Tax=Hevea brasiliensis TaxID=3981 RepID=UPI0025E07569|nr:uncharacterized protein LOC131169349 [Hevea brasiliensis]
MNPKEHCKAITLRSGRTLQEPEEKQTQKEETPQNHEIQEEEEEKQAEESKKEEEKEKKKLPEPYQLHLPFPQRFQKAILDKQFGKFLEVLQKLYINIPFIEALSEMPSYTKYLKEILSKKKRMEDYETVALIEECSVILQSKLPPKLKAPGSFSIPCLIGNMNIDKVLCDLRANVSLMPLSICGRAETNYHLLVIIRQTCQVYPFSILENIPIKVEKFFILVDFIVLEM